MSVATEPKGQDEARARASEERLRSLGFAAGVDGHLEALRSANMAARAEAAFVIGVRHESRARDGLHEALKDESARVRVEAALALARLGDEEPARSALRGELAGELFQDAPLRAARALALLGDPSGYSRVLDALGSSLPSNRMEAVAVLPAFAPFAGGDIEGKRIDPVGSLIAAAGDDEEIIRRDALGALASYEDERIVPALQRAAGDPATAVRDLARGLLEQRLA